MNYVYCTRLEHSNFQEAAARETAVEELHDDADTGDDHVNDGNAGCTPGKNNTSNVKFKNPWDNREMATRRATTTGATAANTIST